MNEKKKNTVQSSLFSWFKKDDTIVEKKEKTLNKKSSLLEIVSTKLPFLKPSSSKSNTVDTIVQNSSVNIYDEIEIVTAGQTLHRETRRISQVDQQEYPSSKKSVDGKTLYQKSLSRPKNTSGNQCIFDLILSHCRSTSTTSCCHSRSRCHADQCLQTTILAISSKSL
jgi:hypothetical protein